MSIQSFQQSVTDIQQRFNRFKTVVEYPVVPASQKFAVIEKSGIDLVKKIAELRQQMATFSERGVAEQDICILCNCSDQLDVVNRSIRTNFRIVTQNLLSNNKNETNELLQRIKAAAPECLNLCSDQEREEINHVFEALKKYSEFDSALKAFNDALEEDSCNTLIETLQKSLDTYVAFTDFIDTHQSILQTNVLQEHDLEERFFFTQSEGYTIVRSLHECLTKLKEEKAPLEDKANKASEFAIVLQRALQIFPEKKNRIDPLIEELSVYQESLFPPQDVKPPANDGEFEEYNPELFGADVVPHSANARPKRSDIAPRAKPVAPSRLSPISPEAKQEQLTAFPLTLVRGAEYFRGSRSYELGVKVGETNFGNKDLSYRIKNLSSGIEHRYLVDLVTIVDGERSVEWTKNGADINLYKTYLADVQQLLTKVGKQGESETLEQLFNMQTIYGVTVVELYQQLENLKAILKEINPAQEFTIDSQTFGQEVTVTTEAFIEAIYTPLVDEINGMFKDLAPLFLE